MVEPHLAGAALRHPDDNDDDEYEGRWKSNLGEFLFSLCEKVCEKNTMSADACFR